MGNARDIVRVIGHGFTEQGRANNLPAILTINAKER
jgi:hypothetical protein